MASRFKDHFLKGTHAARPTAATPPVGTKYACSDHGLVYETDGTTWSTWFDPGVAAITTTKGDLLARSSTALSRLGVGTDGQVLTADAASTLGVKWAAGGGGGGGGADPWVNRLTLPLTSLTGWTVGAGTWTASGSGIRNAATDAGAHRARYTASHFPQGEVVIELDINIAVLNAGTNSRAGILLNYPFGSDTINSLLVVLRGNAGNTAIVSAYTEYEGSAVGPDYPLASSIAPGVTTTMRVHKVGTDLSIWVGGTLLGTSHISQGAQLDASTFSLYGWGTDATYSNLKFWTPTMPGESSPAVVFPAGSADKPPLAPNAKDDEFDGSSTVVWTPTPTVANTFNINTKRLGHAYVKASGSGAALVGAYQAVPGAYPYTITGKASGNARANFHRGGGIFIAPAAPTNTSNAYYVGTEMNSNIQCAAILETLGGSFVTHTPNVMTNWWGPIYCKIVVTSATSVDTYVSTDGWAWQPIQLAANPGFTPGVMGFCNNEEGSAIGVESFFDFFRVS